MCTVEQFRCTSENTHQVKKGGRDIIFSLKFRWWEGRAIIIFYLLLFRRSSPSMTGTGRRKNASPSDFAAMEGFSSELSKKIWKASYFIVQIENLVFWLLLSPKSSRLNFFSVVMSSSSFTAYYANATSRLSKIENIINWSIYPLTAWREGTQMISTLCMMRRYNFFFFTINARRQYWNCIFDTQSVPIPPATPKVKCSINFVFVHPWIVVRL